MTHSVVLPTSPGDSSTKSADASTETPLTSAEKAAARTFGTQPALSSLRPDNQANPAEWEGRRHLKDAFFIELRCIRPDPNQPRKTLDDASLQELADSIRTLGVLQPLAVRYLPDEQVYQLISGERRFQAAKAAGLTEVPCWVQAPEERQVLVRQVVENWQRADLHPFEIADSLGALRDTWNYSQAEIAALIGKSKGDVSKFLSLLSLATDIQQQCRTETSGLLTRKHLENIARLPVAQQPKTLRQVKEQRLNAQETEALVKGTLAKNAGVKQRGAPRSTVFRYATLKATVTIQFRRSHVSTEEQLEALDAARREVLRASDQGLAEGNSAEPSAS